MQKTTPSCSENKSASVRDWILQQPGTMFRRLLFNTRSAFAESPSPTSSQPVACNTFRRFAASPSYGLVFQLW